MLVLEAAQIVGGRFRLLREIGRGAAGAVWRARNETTERDFALKILLGGATSDPLTLRRFINEARAAGRVCHPNVVEVYDTGSFDDGTPYQVMELLEGESLGAKLRRAGSLPLPEALTIVRDVVNGLAAAHALGIVHRDVKPENVFLSASNGHTVAKLLDFGVSKLEEASGDPHATRQGALLGSPAYMSPEQIASATDVDGRADVWAVGVLLYRCLAGRVPFSQRGLRELAIAIASAPPPPLRSVCPDVPLDVEAIVARCLAKSARDRYDDAAALSGALTAALSSLRGDPRHPPLGGDPRHPLGGDPRDPPRVPEPSQAQDGSALSESASSRRADVGRRPSRVSQVVMASCALVAIIVAVTLSFRHGGPPAPGSGSAAPAIALARATSAVGLTALRPMDPAPRAEVAVPARTPAPAPNGRLNDTPRARPFATPHAPARPPNHEGVVEPGF